MLTYPCGMSFGKQTAAPYPDYTKVSHRPMISYGITARTVKIATCLVVQLAERFSSPVRKVYQNDRRPRVLNRRYNRLPRLREGLKYISVAPVANFPAPYSHKHGLVPYHVRGENHFSKLRTGLGFLGFVMDFFDFLDFWDFFGNVRIFGI